MDEILKNAFGTAISTATSQVNTQRREDTCDLEDGSGCVGECYDTCDCYCENYSPDD